MATTTPRKKRSEFCRRWDKAGNPNYMPTVRVWANTHGLIANISATTKLKFSNVLDAAVRHYAKDVLRMNDVDIQSIEHVIGYVPNQTNQTTEMDMVKNQNARERNNVACMARTVAEELFELDAQWDVTNARQSKRGLLLSEENRQRIAVADSMLNAVADKRTQAEIRDLALDEVTDEHRLIEAQLLATATRLFIAASKTKHRVSPAKAVHDAKDLMVQTRYYRKANHMSGSYPDV